MIREFASAGVSSTAGRFGRYTAVAASTFCAGLLAGCDVLDNLVSVDSPSRIAAEVLETPENAERLLDGAIADFECAFGQYVLFQGVFTNELQYAAGSESWRSIDSRNLNVTGFDAPHASGTCSAPHQGQVPGVYKPLSTARWQADHLLELIEGWPADQVANREQVRATAAAYSGYSQLLLAESMCSAAFDLGPELQPAQIFERAEGSFAIALAAAGSDRDLVQLALVGRARARLGRGNASGAKSDAEQVSAGFTRNAEYSIISARRENPVFVRNVRGSNVTIELPYRQFADPRVRVADQRRSSSSGIPIWTQLKYAAANTPIRVASWEEAQLIIAEAELSAGNLAAAVAAINRVRTRSGVALAPFSGTNRDEVRSQLILERAAEHFL
ncbi:MAG: RagB/SusD family nutrient uptake outer membrane protein, partial [Gemmatimonadetes bacterium]|nr:RagB/SusD family nutrient uptake outer membrane protein [Gemmatimonadota bacterium]